MSETVSLPSLLREAARRAVQWLKRKTLLLGAIVAGLLLLPFLLGLLFGGHRSGEFIVRRGTLEPTVPLVGTLNAARSETYGATVPGVELKILSLVEEGTLVAPGDRLIQFDPAPFQKDLDTARARARELAGEADQARLALDSLRLKTTVELQERRSTAQVSERELDSLVNTGAPLSAQESQHELEQRERALREAEVKLAGLEPFVAEGYISQEEYRSARARRDQAAADLRLAQAKHSALVHQMTPDLIRKKVEEAESSRMQFQIGRERSRVELAQVEAAARVSTARLEEAQRQIGEAEKKIAASTVVAKAPGLAVHSEVYDKGGERRKIRVGDSVWGGTTVVTLPDLSRMVVEGRVPESEIHLLAPGQVGRARLDAFPDLQLTGVLRSIGSVGASEKNESRSFPVAITLDQTDLRLRPGMIARCSILCGRVENALVIPIVAVRSDEHGPFVVVVPALGRNSLRRITTGSATSQFVQVRHGLREGEVVRIAGD